MSRLWDIVEEWERERKATEGATDITETYTRGTDVNQLTTRNLRGRILAGHRVRQVIWETDKAVIFSDASGRFWRYLYAYKQAWPVIVSNRVH